MERRPELGEGCIQGIEVHVLLAMLPGRFLGLFCHEWIGCMCGSCDSLLKITKASLLLRRCSAPVSRLEA